MSIYNIHESKFSLVKLNENAYQLNIDFLDGGKKTISDKSFIFSQTQSVEIGEIVDIYSQNGQCSAPIINLFNEETKALFTEKDVRGLEKAKEQMKAQPSFTSSVIALDIKDLQKSYLDKETILEAEKATCTFLNMDKPPLGSLSTAIKVHSILKEGLKCNYILGEGSLKFDILHNFSESQAAWFLETKQGTKSFCQCAEFFMNAFKLGQSAKELTENKYIYSLSSMAPPFIPLSKSTVWYPESYKKLYSIDGNFANCLRQVFSLEGSEGFKKETKITSITLEVKP